MLTHVKSLEEQDHCAKADILSRLSFGRSNEICGDAGI